MWYARPGLHNRLPTLAVAVQLNLSLCVVEPIADELGAYVGVDGKLHVPGCWRILRESLLNALVTVNRAR